MSVVDSEKDSSTLHDFSEDDIPEELQEILESMPKEKRKDAERFVVEKTFGLMGIGQMSQENEIAKKITERHISSFLDGSREQMQNDYKERHEKKIFTVILVFLALCFFIAVIVLLKDKPDILEKIIYSVAGLVAGAFGGYGFGRHQSKDDD